VALRFHPYPVLTIETLRNTAPFPAQVLDQNVRKPHPKMIDIVMMPLPGTVKHHVSAGADSTGKT
jgi:hypothetical protein